MSFGSLSDDAASAWGNTTDFLSAKKPDLSASTAAGANARSQAAAYGADRQNYQTQSAPQIGGSAPTYGAGTGPAPAGSPGSVAAASAGAAGAYGPAVEGRTGASHFNPAQSLQPAGYTGMPSSNAAMAGGATGQGMAFGAGAHDIGAPNPISNQTRQQGALDMLEGAANGTSPSAAQIQSSQQLGNAMANQYALASGLQGRHPGAAFDSASRGAATVQGQVIGQGAVQRAQEQAQARDAYASATGGARGQDIQTDVANLNAKLTTMGYDEQTRNALLAAQLQSQGYDVSTANAIIGAQTAAADSANKFKGGLLQGGAGALAALI